MAGNWAKYDLELIKGALKELDRRIERVSPQAKVKAVLVGAAGLILKYNLKKKTGDIDVCVIEVSSPKPIRGFGELFSHWGIQMIPEGFLLLPEDYEERLVPVEGLNLKHIELFTLHPVDMAVSKIARGTEKDLNDLIDSGVLDELDLETLEKEYFQMLEYSVGDPVRLKGNWYVFTKMLRERENAQTNRRGSPRSKGPSGSGR